MKNRILAGIFAAMLILGGCSSNPEAETSSIPASEPVFGECSRERTGVRTGTPFL